MKEWYDIEDNFMKHKDVISQLVFENGVTGDRQPLVTVAIPAYKRPGLLRDAVDSALCQEGFRDFEILIVDDYPSEDQEMQEYLSQLANTETDIKIRYYRNQRNMGMGGNWNRCIKLSRGEWVVLLHDDDMMCADYLKKVLPVAIKTNCSLLGTFSYQMNLLERSGDRRRYTRRLEKNKALLQKIRRSHAFYLKKRDVLNFIQPSPGCWLLNRRQAIELGGYDASRIKNGLIDGPFDFKNTYHKKTVILPQFLFTRRIKENDFLNPEAQEEILDGLFRYLLHYAERYGFPGKLAANVSTLNFARGMKAKYNAEIDTKAILKAGGGIHS